MWSQKTACFFVFGDVKAAEVNSFSSRRLVDETRRARLNRRASGRTTGKPESVESRKDKAQGVIMVGYRGADIFSPDRYALQLIDEASSDLGSRFFIRIREQMGLAYYVGATQMEELVPGVLPVSSGHRSAKKSSQ